MSEVGRQTNGDNASAGAACAAFNSARLDHVGVDVSDFDAQIAFYRAAFGLTVDQRATLEKYDFTYALLRHRDGWGIELFKREGVRERAIPGDPDRQHDVLGLGHLCLSVEDLPAAHDHLVALGAISHIPPGPSPAPDIAFAYLADPEGNLIELISRLGV